MCGSSRVLFLDGSGVVGRRNDHVPGNQAVVINTGKYAREKSDWAVAEVMTWDRELEEEEMRRASKYLRQVLNGPVVRTLFLFRFGHMYTYFASAMTTPIGGDVCNIDPLSVLVAPASFSSAQRPLGRTLH